MNQVSLDDIFDDETYVERRLVARHRIIGVFDVAIDPFSKRGTDNFIVGVAERISDLADYVSDKMRHRRNLIVIDDLPFRYAPLPKKQREKVCQPLRRQLIIDELIAMRDAEEIYWQDGRWQAKQSLIDEYVRFREVRQEHYRKVEEVHRTALRIKRDNRTYHGRPRQQTKRRGIPEGTSIGCVA